MFPVTRGPSPFTGQAENKRVVELKNQPDFEDLTNVVSNRLVANGPKRKAGAVQWGDKSPQKK